MARRPSGPNEVAGDLSDPESLTAALDQVRPDVVVHLAGVTFPAHPSLSEIYQVNVGGGANLIDALKRTKAQPSQILVASSATVYAPSDEPLAEDARLSPLNHYAASKLAMEHMFGLEPSLPVQVLRPFNYTGPGQAPNFLVPKIVKHFAEDRDTIELGNIDLYRDISALDDVVESYVRLIDQAQPGPVLNLCSGVGTKLRDVVEILQEIAGRSIEIVSNPAFFREGEPQRIVGDRARLDARIGAWSRKPLAALLREMYEAMRA